MFSLNSYLLQHRAGRSHRRHAGAAAKDPNTAEIMDLVTHEQYFWPFYMNYIPDHFAAARHDASAGCTEHGYKPVFYHEGFLGGRV